MKDLRATVLRLATAFANDLLLAIRTAPVDEIYAGVDASARVSARPSPSAKASSKATRVRRTSSDIAKTADAIVTLLKKHQSGLRAEQIRAKLAMPKSELTRPIVEALNAKRIVKTGEKRATTYFAR